MKSGSHLAFILCILFLESRLHLIKAIDIPPKKLCSEDVLVLLQHLSSSPCKVTDETDIILDNKIRDVRNCLVHCYINGSIWSKSNITSPCPRTNVGKVSDSIETEGQLRWANRFSSCCDNSEIEVNINGYCNYTVYNRKSLKLGERCIYGNQCESPLLTCFGSRCSCKDGYTEYKGQCLMIDVGYGDRCMHSFQCTFAGGICSTRGKCLCRSDFVFDGINECVPVKKLREKCDFNEQCGTTFNPMQCLERECSCMDGYKEIHGHCYKIVESLSFGDKCMLNEQCWNHGGYCNGTCSCIYDYEYSKEANGCIRAWNLQVGDKCTLNSQCDGTENSMICTSKRCACKTGYIQLHGMCLKDELPLHTQCITSRQCSSSQFPLICDTSEHCVCAPGYIFEDSTCLKDVKQTGGPEMQQSESNQDTVVVGAAVGSLVIGVIIGVLTTLGAMFLLKRSKAKKDCATEKSSVGRHKVYEEKLQMVSKQDTYEQIGSVEEKNNTTKDVELNSENVYHVVDPTPSAPIEDKNNKQEEESVYNHLFEKVEESETSTYDNPLKICTGRDNQAFVEEGKAQNAGHDNQAFVEERMSRDTSLPEDDKLAGFNRGSPNVANENSESDDYFVLECNK